MFFKHYLVLSNLKCYFIICYSQMAFVKKFVVNFGVMKERGREHNNKKKEQLLSQRRQSDNVIWKENRTESVNERQTEQVRKIQKKREKIGKGRLRMQEREREREKKIDKDSEKSAH